MKKLLGDLLKRRVFIALLVMEIFLLLGCVAFLFGKEKIYQQEVDNVTLAAGECYEISDITLPKGTYLIKLRYDTDFDYANICEVVFENMGYKGGYCNAFSLFAGCNQTEQEVWVNRDAENISVVLTAGGGTLQVYGLEFCETHASDRIRLLALCAILLLINAVYVLCQMDKRGYITIQQKLIGCSLLGIMILSSIPLMVDGIYSSGDIGYHLMRIEGLKDGLLSGQFPVRIAPNWQQGNGYADAMFYCELLLLPAAILRMIGFTVTASYRIYMLLMNMATTVLAYWAFAKVFKNRYVGVFCSSLYTLSLYRFVMTFAVGGLGETAAMLWLPVFILGFYKVYCDDTTAKQYNWSWIPLAIAFSGMVSSHMLGSELVGGFTILLCVIMWRKTLEKRRFAALLKTVIGFLTLTAWFWIPFADYMLTGDFVIQHVSGRTIQERGLYLAHLLNPVFFAGSEVFIDKTGMLDTLPMGIGIGLFLVAAAWFVIGIVCRRECEERKMLTKSDMWFGNILFCFSILSLVMSLNSFPWNYFQSMNGIFASLISSLQRPYRVLTMANVFLVTLAGLLIVIIARCGKKMVCVSFACVVVGLTLFVTLFATSDFMFKTRMTRIYNSQGMGTGYISGAEYLPYNVDASKLTYHNPISSENVIVEGFEKGALQREVNCYNVSAEDGNVTVDLLYYKGYRAFDADTGEELAVYAGSNGLVTVNVPTGYDGIVEISFVSPWYWRMAEIISCISVVGMFVLYQRDKKRMLMQKEA